MAKKIPSVEGDVKWKTIEGYDIPLQQQSEFSEYREFMAATAKRDCGGWSRRGPLTPRRRENSGSRTALRRKFATQ